MQTRCTMLPGSTCIAERHLRTAPRCRSGLLSYSVRRHPRLRQAKVPLAVAQPLSPSDVPQAERVVIASDCGTAMQIVNNNIVPKPVKKDAPKAVSGAMSEEEESALHNMLARVKAAQEEYASFTQEQVDAIFKAAASAANSARIPLAKMAVEETGMGLLEDKVIKNHFASEYIYNKYKSMRTCGIIEESMTGGIQRFAEPVGVVCGIVPTTNPTSTAIFKCLIALKTRNGIVLSPHPRAAKSTIEAARIVRDAAVAAGAPANIIGWVEHPTSAVSAALMKAPEVNLILATGGPGMVNAAYSSGHPALGVGAGNTPAVIDETADIRLAVSSIVLSKTFDNGVICASEQSVIVMDTVYDQVKQEFERRGAHFLDAEQKAAMGAKLLKDGHINADVVGQSIPKLAQLAGISVPNHPKLLIGEASEVGPSEPFSYEKLCPVLAMYKVSSFEEGVTLAEKLVEFGGPGHTSVLYTHPDNKQRIAAFESTVKTTRVLINTPSSQGGIGDLYNFHLDPSLTLGCGTWGKTSVSANVGPQHLLNIKTITSRRENMLWFRVPPKIYFKRGCLEFALRDLQGRKRAFVVTDKPLYEMGLSNQVTDVLEDLGITTQVFYNVEPDPTLATVEAGLAQLKTFNPDVIIALGGGSPMDAAKVMWLMYEHPETKFDGLAMRFMDIRKRVYDVPTLGMKALMVAIPTTSGTGSEVTPFSVVTDQHTGVKYPLADYALTPNMAIVDPDLVDRMPKGLTAAGGIDAVTHALESYVSVCATEYTQGLSKEALVLLFKHLPSAYKQGHLDTVAREKVHYAATIAGMAFANAFLGICHSMAHKLGSNHHIPHGIANALLISHVIRYNATDSPFKQAIFPQYAYPAAKSRYAELADALQLTPNDATEEEKVVALIRAVEDLKRELDIPPTIKEFVGAEREKEYLDSLEQLAESAFDDQCTGANPRYPLIKDLKTMLKEAWEAPITPLTTLQAPQFDN